MRIIVSHYNNPYETTSAMEIKRVFCGSHSGSVLLSQIVLEIAQMDMLMDTLTQTVEKIQYGRPPECSFQS